MSKVLDKNLGNHSDINLDDRPLPKEKLYVFLLAAIQLSHILDFVVLMPLGPTLMRVLGISPIQFGTLVSSYNFSAAIFGIIYGLVADNYGRKKILLVCFVGFILGTLYCGFSDSFQTLMIGRIIAGAFGGILTSVVMAMITDLIPFQRRGRAMGTVMAAFSVASVLGVPIGLIIANSYGWQNTFIFIAAVSVIVFIVAAIVFPSLNDHVCKTSKKESLKRLGRILVKPDYAKAYSLIFINVVSAFMLIPFLAPFAVKNIGILETELKYLYLVGGFFTIMTAILIGKSTDKNGAFKTFLLVDLLACIPIYLYTNAESMTLFVFLSMSAFFMTTVSGRFIPLMTLITQISSAKDRGTFMGLINSVRGFSSATATLIAGAIIVENADGTLGGFNKVGYLSIFLSIGIIFLAKHVQGIALRNKNE